MSQPSVRIILTARERKRLIPGLEHLVNGLGSFMYCGSTPNANPGEWIDLRLAAVHKDRAFDLQLAHQVLSVRKNVKWPTRSGKFDLTVVELSFLALALRVSRKLGKARGNGSRLLEAKLENFRKRAKRAAIAQMGEQEYKETTSQWRRFLSWMRFYLVCSRWPQRPGTLKMIWRDQRSQLIVLIKNALSEISDVQVPEATVVKMAGLLKAELRRGYRHPVILTEMLRGEPASLPVLRNFLLKRLDLDPLKPQAGPFYMQLADPPKPVPVMVTDSEDQHHEDEARNKRDGVVTSVPGSASAPPVRHKNVTSLTEEEAVRCLVPWWREAVPRDYRADVWEEAKRQLMWQWQKFVVPTTALTAHELFQQTRPSYTPEIDPEAINHAVEWLLGWCLALTRDWWRVFNLMEASYHLAKKEELSQRGREAQDISEECHTWKLPYSIFLLCHCSSAA